MIKLTTLDALLDDLYSLERFRQSEIETKGLDFTVQGTATAYKGLEASGSSYFFFKRDCAWNPGTILEQGNRQFVVLSTDRAKVAHDVVGLLYIPDVVNGCQIVDTGKKDLKGKPILKLQETHKFLQCSFDATRSEVRFFEVSAPYIGTILRHGGEHYRIVAASTRGGITTCKVLPCEVPK